MSVIGLDPSLTATGVATYNRNYVISTKLKGPERMVEIRGQVMELCLNHQTTLVVMEAPAFMSKGRSAKEIGGIWWVLRVMLYEQEIKTLAVTPSTLKKYATGKGNANKSEVLAAAIRRLDYDGADDNEADAMWLREVGIACTHRWSPTDFDRDPLELPAVNVKALDVLEEQWRSLNV